VNRFQSWYRIQPRALRALLTINVVAYLLWQVLLRHIPGVYSFVWTHLALNPALPGILLEPWQLITYNFLHLQPGFGGFLHILFNMLWLVWIGREYEEMHGAHRLLSVYLITGLGGGLLTVLLLAVTSGASLFSGSVHGASAAVFGVMTVVATRYPYKTIGLLFIGNVRIVYLVLGLLALNLVFLGGGTSISAHMGGALAGFLMARAELRGVDLSTWAGIFFRNRTSKRARSRSSEEESILKQMESWLAGRRGEKETPPRSERTSPFRSRESAGTGTDTEPSMEGEVDRILDKISEQGYDALSDEEKRILYEASRR